MWQSPNHPFWFLTSSAPPSLVTKKHPKMTKSITHIGFYHHWWHAQWAAQEGREVSGTWSIFKICSILAFSLNFDKNQTSIPCYKNSRTCSSRARHRGTIGSLPPSLGSGSRVQRFGCFGFEDCSHRCRLGFCRPSNLPQTHVRVRIEGFMSLRWRHTFHLRPETKARYVFWVIFTFTFFFPFFILSRA